jgi:hypothetical protein
MQGGEPVFQNNSAALKGDRRALLSLEPGGGVSHYPETQSNPRRPAASPTD